MAGHITVKLQEILTERGFTQRQFADRCGLRQARIAAICKGYIDRIELDHIIKISDALQLVPDAWMTYTSDWMMDGYDEEREREHARQLKQSEDERA